MKTLRTSCSRCDEVFVLEVRDDDLDEWLNGKYVQEAFPYLTPAQRELLISQTCGKCFDKIFAEEG